MNELLHYLGDVQRREQEGVPYRVDLGDGRTPRLFRLWEHEPPDARMSVEYGGRRWWVAGHDPAAPGDMTTTVLSLANLLLNLQKSAGELPAAGTLAAGSLGTAPRVAGVAAAGPRRPSFPIAPTHVPAGG